MTKCETRFFFPIHLHAAFYSSSRSSLPYLGYMHAIGVPSCHGRSLILSLSSKYNYCWLRSNPSCVTDNQTGAKSIWFNCFWINCGIVFWRHPGFNCGSFSFEQKPLSYIDHGMSTVMGFRSVHMLKWWHLSSRAIGPLSDICLKFVRKDRTSWHMHVTQCPCR